MAEDQALSRRGRLRSFAVGFIVVVGIAAVALGLHAGGRPDGADPTDERLVAEGRQVYAQHCARCHGANLEGQPNWRTLAANGRRPAPPHDQTGHTWHHPDATLFRIVKYGGVEVARGMYQSDMPAFEDVLDDEQIWAVLAFIKSHWPADIRRLHDEMNQQAQ